MEQMYSYNPEARTGHSEWRVIYICYVSLTTLQHNEHVKALEQLKIPAK